MYYKFTSLIDGTVKSIASMRPNGYFAVTHADGNTEQADSLQLIEERDSCKIDEITETAYKSLFSEFFY